MGALRNLDINNLINKYKPDIFIETGSGYGTGIFTVLQYPFRAILSVEIDNEQCNLLQQFFRFDSRVKVFNGLSKDFLLNILKQIPKEISSLIFLDAHFPSADLGRAGFSDEKDETIRMPLLYELDIIIDERINKGCRDIIIIDDIMLYDDTQEYEASHQKLTMDILPKNDRNCLDKILSKFKETHNATILTKEQGWLILTPK